MNTKAEGIEMAEFGHAKDDSGIPQVNISYAVNHADATPLFYEMYPGSIIDNTQCSHMVEKAKEYDFLMMIKTNSSLVTEMLKEAHLPLLTKARYYLPEHDVYGLTKKGTIGDDMTVRYFHIYYDNVRASQEKNEYLKQLVKKEKHLLRYS